LHHLYPYVADKILCPADEIFTVAGIVVREVDEPAIIKPVTITEDETSPSPRAIFKSTLNFVIFEGIIVNTTGTVFVPEDVNAAATSAPGANVRVIGPLYTPFPLTFVLVDGEGAIIALFGVTSETPERE
jgi:hypothetical protein